MTFQAGQINNPNGARTTRRWRAALDRALARVGEGEIDGGLNKVADRVIQAALDGDKDAWREIAERQDGKVPQGVVGGGDGSDPIQASLRVLFGRD